MTFQILDRAMPERYVYQCGLLHGTQYVAQIRVRYQQSPWSEWSAGRPAFTLEAGRSSTHG